MRSFFRFSLIPLLMLQITAAAAPTRQYIVPLIPYFTPTMRTQLDSAYRGDPDATLQQLAREAQSKPRDLSSRLRLLLLRADLGEEKGIRSALKEYRKAVYRHPAWLRRRRNLYFYLARATGIAGQHALALKRHLANYRTSRWSRNLYFAAHSLLKLKQFGKARRYMQQYLTRVGIRRWKPAYYLEWANYYRQAHRFAQAVRMLKAGLVRFPGKQEIWEELIRLGGHSPAVRDFVIKRGFLAGEKNPKILFYLTDWLVNNGYARQAQKGMLAIRTRCAVRNSAFFHYRLLHLCNITGATDLASGVLSRLQLLRKGKAGAGELHHLYKEQLHLQLRSGQPETVRKELSKKGGRLSDMERAIYDLSIRLHTVGTNQKTAGDSPPVLFQQSLYTIKRVTALYGEHNQREALLPFWRDFIKKHPDPANLWEYGSLLAACGRHKEAYPVLYLAWDAAPDSARWLTRISLTALEAGLYKEADEFLRRSVCRIGLDNLYRVMGDARFHRYRQLLRIRTNHTPAERTLLSRFPLPDVSPAQEAR